MKAGERGKWASMATAPLGFSARDLPWTRGADLGRLCQQFVNVN
jgi:hypothetical protein